MKKALLILSGAALGAVALWQIYWMGWRRARSTFDDTQSPFSGEK